MAVVALAVIGIAAMQFNNNKSADQAASTTESMQQQDMVVDTGAVSPVTEDTNMVEVTLKNGTYNATGGYTSPAGEETIGVMVTLTDGIITEAEVEPQAVNEVSKKMQNSFKDGFKELVIGKPISEVKLSKVSASSLTSGGFNEALQKIIQEAGS